MCEKKAEPIGSAFNIAIAKKTDLCYNYIVREISNENKNNRSLE